MVRESGPVLLGDRTTIASGYNCRLGLGRRVRGITTLACAACAAVLVRVGVGRVLGSLAAEYGDDNDYDRSY